MPLNLVADSKQRPHSELAALPPPWMGQLPGTGGPGSRLGAGGAEAQAGLALIFLGLKSPIHFLGKRNLQMETVRDRELVFLTYQYVTRSCESQKTPLSHSATEGHAAGRESYTSTRLCAKEQAPPGTG